MARLRLTGGSVLDVRGGALEPADLLIDGARIAAVGRHADFPDDVSTLDVTGLTLLPGLSNNHVHLGWSGMGWDGGPTGILRQQALEDSDGINGIKAVANLRKSLRAGLTSLRDLGMNDSGFDAKEALRRGMVRGPRLAIAGRAIMCTGGHTWWCGREADGVDDVRRAVREQFKRGADIIKIMASERHPQFTLAELRAAADETHLHGGKITAHATIPQAIRNVVDAGFDSVEHGGPADDETLALMAERGVMVVPTLSPFFLQTERGPARGMPEHVVAARHERFRKNPPGPPLARMREAGIRFAFGTDAGSPCVPHDEIVAEMRLLLEREVVTSPLEVVRMLTLNAAELRGEAADLGTLEPGKLADIVAVDGNPLDTVDALGQVRHVFLDGEHVVKDGALDDWYAW